MGLKSEYQLQLSNRCCEAAASPKWSEKPGAYAVPTRIALSLGARRYRLQREYLLALT